MAIPNGALPQTQAAYVALTTDLAHRGIVARLADFGGTRTQADTTTILGYRQADYNHDNGLPADTVTDVSTLNAYRPIAPYGLSFHNYGAAFDLVFSSLPSGMTSDGAYQLAGSLAPQYGLRWGGYFSNPDIRHFELDQSLAEVQAAYAQLTGGTQLPPSTSAFDLSAFLPGLTPQSPPLPDLSDLPPVEYIGDGSGSADDSGESYGFLDGVSAVPQADQQLYRQVGLFALAGVAVGVVVWAIKRKFAPNPSRSRTPRRFALEGD